MQKDQRKPQLGHPRPSTVSLPNNISDTISENAATTSIAAKRSINYI
jgi:hypothetical protein